MNKIEPKYAMLQVRSGDGKRELVAFDEYGHPFPLYFKIPEGTRPGHHMQATCLRLGLRVAAEGVDLGRFDDDEGGDREYDHETDTWVDKPGAADRDPNVDPDHFMCRSHPNVPVAFYKGHLQDGETIDMRALADLDIVYAVNGIGWVSSESTDCMYEDFRMEVMEAME